MRAEEEPCEDGTRVGLEGGSPGAGEEPVARVPLKPLLEFHDNPPREARRTGLEVPCTSSGMANKPGMSGWYSLCSKSGFSPYRSTMQELMRSYHTQKQHESWNLVLSRGPLHHCSHMALSHLPQDI
jgi:hypothetical protein